MSNAIGLEKLPGTRLSEQVHNAIRLAILEESLEAGQTLCIEDLAAELGVSTTPVREALARLAANGLVTLARNRKPVVASISVDEIVQIYMMRRLLEPYYAHRRAYEIGRDPLAREAISSLRDDILEFVDLCSGIRSRAPTTIYAAHLALDRRLQELILPSDGGDVLGKLANVINNYVYRLRLFSKNASGADRTKRILTVCQEHIRITDALLDGDATSIERSILDHLTHSEERSLQAMETESSQAGVD